MRCENASCCFLLHDTFYSRNLEDLSQFKYAGYTELIRTIDLEADDSNLFGGGHAESGQLLSAAVELCYWTLRSSALNAEQLRRESGLEALYKTFQRCSPLVTAGSKEDDLPVQVCVHICNCFSTAGLFEACREKFTEMSALFASICHLLRYEVSRSEFVVCYICSFLASCSFGVCSSRMRFVVLGLQPAPNASLPSGVIWHLLPHLFHFDYTLDEGGVQHNEASNRQAVSNRLARNSIESLACLAGFR